MAYNRERNLKQPMIEDYGRSIKEGYWNGMYDRIKHYRALLKMYKELQQAEYERHQAELEVYRISGKLEVIEDLFNDDALMEVKEKLKSELVLAEANLADKKVPTMNWDKLGEPHMWR
ncbi:unnamed protein product [Eruca vesicaria subsp. sativa]|uniref:NADH dehydrogenase [ubiquinone] 1 alpha subcomplex subunit 5 n=1 Tax=Eruca vesicaria subsp. sativa TaxID=29727 RepID=A0ABC8LM60_ERUVS|nr:unnamed protein product [Eruca vesicaria subsp. sativa]